MSFKNKLFFFVLIVITLISIAILWFNSQILEYKPGVSDEADKAVNQALLFYREAVKAKQNFKNGPCLTNSLFENWVVDIVHSPRNPIDDIPENQCPAYREGKANHFVELDMDGNVVRVK